VTPRHTNSRAQPARAGIHGGEWAAEAAGTALLLLGGLLFAGSGTGIAALAWGRTLRSAGFGATTLQAEYPSVFKTMVPAAPPAQDPQAD
jgi:hypothetical protein